MRTILYHAIVYYTMLVQNCRFLFLDPPIEAEARPSHCPDRLAGLTPMQLLHEPQLPRFGSGGIDRHATGGGSSILQTCEGDAVALQGRQDLPRPLFWTVGLGKR